MWHKKATYQFLEALKHVQHGQICVVTPDGKQHHFGSAGHGPVAELVLHDWRAIGAFAVQGDIGFAQAYRDGWWDSNSMTDLFILGLSNEAILSRYIYGSLLGQLATRMAYFFTRNTLQGSKRNIHAHYDLGNDFYALWLDESMSYSSALFASPTESLYHAQMRKYDRITDTLKPSGSLLEIGCGWGGFAERALQQGDYAIKGVTLSQQQQLYAAQRLGKAADIVIEDYRIQQGRYDHIVSIEMFEAVGEQFWQTYFQKLKALLAAKGHAVIQTITIDEAYFEKYRKSGDMIRSYIFPGGMLPSPSRFKQEAGKAGFHITDMFAFGQDYALTLEHWLARFESQLERVRLLHFDEGFIRLWRFYLAACIASFKVGRTSVMQVELRHA